MYILLGLMIAGFGVAGWFIYGLDKKVKKLFGGAEPDGTTGIQENLVKRMVQAETKLEELEPRVKILEEISKISVQKVGFMRYNPFSETGGDNSFVMALLDRENNGVIVSSLYMREGTRLYAKKIEGGMSKQPLSDEEKRVLEEAMNK